MRQAANRIDLTRSILLGMQKRVVFFSNCSSVRTHAHHNTREEAVTNTSISYLNKQWGICGFASALGALYQNNKSMAGMIDQAEAKGQLDTRLLAEIKSYLVILQSENNSLLLNEITRFTRTFGGAYSAFDIQKYIDMVNSIGKDIANVGKDFSIAMPPNAVADYLRRVCGVKAVLVGGTGPNLNNVILGLGDKTKSDEWNGLNHWVYKANDSEVYNYGRSLPLATVLQSDTNWHIVYQVAIG